MQLNIFCNNFSNRYLRERKEAQEKEQKAKAEALNADCPEGHVSLPDNERKETLRLLKKSA